MNHLNNRSRRKFLMNLARAGLLLPFAGQMLGQSVMAQTAGARRVLFLYYPNGVVPYNWGPVQDSGTITNGNELSFGLGPLKNWHNRMIVFKNLNLDIGSGAGAHYNDMRGILTGNNQISDGSASIDHLIAERLGDEGVLSLGVRTGPKADAMISKPRNVNTSQRPIPNNDPADVAQKLALKIGTGEVSDLKRRMYDAILSDFDSLANAALEKSRQDKIDLHTSALVRLRDQTGVQVGECGFNPNPMADPYAYSTGQLSPTQWQMFPHLCRAQIDNIVGAFACGLHRVATLQLSKGDENGNLVNYSYDECWQMSQDAIAQGIKADPAGGTVGNITRWYNEFASHNASHRPGDVPHTAQVRWYHSLLAYTLEQLQAKGILDDTLVVMFSEVGDGSKHGGAAGAVTLAGGAGSSLQMGRVIYGGDGINNGYRVWGTHELFGDIAKLMGVTNLPESHWRGGVIA
ncbi:DUF1552 domain-containing protein [Cellvibrio japonicus]|uniref:Tat (Twin-arginine translocation) pathway signal sequence domain protein n=1 Tax=Cellvibrio japonicus (strain Ueda107) TaxID=498211 RepID=B3PC54_CELJU|nr:DUF1552 domain-containing protein [Cellvibrio japonicus]ACE82783.1 Tat (twin-arginine translocation) pathway signal sequence domain protein [Cellvibrio japonicus Ueda107]QEI13200.1 DUF1552 domain-containing protein [Cellvibrio japonicus]QEI16774.1 DUF1552 domain-containing protein [Cellvibrio japonicus]QEI20352.1 DUF1552 domain-containing protein [Cellvibrio japonicus]